MRLRDRVRLTAAGGTMGLMVVAGCAGEREADPPAWTSWDSAGVEVVTLRELPPLDAAEWRWRLERVDSVPLDGAHAGAEPLAYQPRRIVRRLGGGYILVDGGPSPFVMLGSDGKLDGRFGTWGQGPGEVRSDMPMVWSVGVDSFVAADVTSRQLFFGNVGAGVTGTALLGSGTVYKPQAVKARHGEPGLFLHDWLVEAGPDGIVSRGDSVYRIWPPSSGPAAALPHRVEDPEGVKGGAYLMAPRQVFAPLAGGVVATGRTDLPEIRIYREGRLERIVRLPLVGEEIGELQRREILQEFGSLVAGKGFDPGKLATAVAPVLPLYTRMNAFGDTVVALEHSRNGFAAGDPRPGEDVRVLRLVSVSGRYLGSVTLPLGFETDDFSPEAVMVVRVDPEGRSALLRYRPVPPAAR